MHCLPWRTIRENKAYGLSTTSGRKEKREWRRDFLANRARIFVCFSEILMNPGTV